MLLMAQWNAGVSLMSKLQNTKVLYCIDTIDYKVIKLIHESGGIYVFDDRGDCFDYESFTLCLNFFGDLVFEGTSKVFARKKDICRSRKTAIKRLSAAIDEEISRLTKLKEAL
jgi:hypothetical protein